MTAEIEATREHRDGCMTEHTWDEDDCNCRCSVCSNLLAYPNARCRWGDSR